MGEVLCMVPLGEAMSVLRSADLISGYDSWQLVSHNCGITTNPAFTVYL